MLAIMLRSLKYFDDLEHDWYVENEPGQLTLRKKIVPKSFNLEKFIMMAWICDDGCYCSEHGLRLATQCFNLDEIERLRTLLQNKRSLIVTKRSSDELYIWKESLIAFSQLMPSYFPTSFLYKI